MLVVAAAPPKVAVPTFTGVGLEKPRLEFFTEQFAADLRQAGLTVVTQGDIGALLGLERQKQLLGCSDDSSACMAELANALGTDVVVLGAVATLGQDALQVTVKLIASMDGAVLAQRSGRVKSQLQLSDALTVVAHELGREGLAKLRPGEPVPPLPEFSRRPLRPLSWLPALLGLAGVGVGIGMSVSAVNAHVRLTDHAQPPLPSTDAMSLVAAGKSSQAVAVAGFAAGLVGLGVGAFFFFFTEERARLQAQLLLSPSGVALVGAWP